MIQKLFARQRPFSPSCQCLRPLAAEPLESRQLLAADSLDGFVEQPVCTAPSGTHDDAPMILDAGDYAVSSQKSGKGSGGKNGPKQTGSVSVSPTQYLQTSEDGIDASFQVVLESQPTAIVTIDLLVSDATEGSLSVDELVFMPSNWDVPQSVTIYGIPDDVEDGDITYVVETSARSDGDINYQGVDVADVSVTNLDVDDGKTNLFYASDFSYEKRERVTRSGTRFTEYRFVATFKFDTDNDFTASEGDAPASGVTLAISLYDSVETNLNSGSNFRNFVGVTNEAGVFATPWVRLNGQSYRAEITDAYFDGYFWDTYEGLESALQDEDEDGRPDLIFP